MHEKNVAVVILNYNGLDYLKEFLPGVMQHSENYTVYVADNGSSDTSVVFLREKFPEVRLIINQENKGYAAGYNEALSNLKEEFFVLLNSDVAVGPNWIEPVLELFQHKPELGACQPKLLDLKLPDHFEYAGASGGFIDRLGYPFCRGRIFQDLEKDLGQFNDAREVFWASGACLFVRAAAFWEAGGLDGDYFAHMEEIDLCWRLRNIGYSIMVEPSSVVYHLGGGTLNKQSTQKTFLNFRNNLSTLLKNDIGLRLFFKIPFRLVLDGVAGIKFLSAGQAQHSLAVLKAHFAFYARIPSLLRKRRQIRKHKNFRQDRSMIYKGSIVYDYYLRKLNTFNALSSGFFTQK